MPITPQPPTTLVLLLLTCVRQLSCLHNTTTFWQQSLNLSQIDYQSYTGYHQINWYFPVDRSAMFYNLFGAVGHDVMVEDQHIPLILWLQGGPGWGAQFGAFLEIGPVRILNGGPLRFFSPWNIFGHLLFVDSPLNAGFSLYGDRLGKQQVSNTEDATNHLINFLSNFYQQLPSLKKSPLFIAGQSFAGHYIPNLAKKILSNNTFLSATGIKLSGISIGNGWVDPINQINFYDSYLWSVGVVGNKFRDECSWYQTHSLVNLYDSKLENATKYVNFITENKTTSQIYMGNISMFNFRNYDAIDLSFADFLNHHKDKLGATSDYILSNAQIYEAFTPDISKSYAADLTYVLKRIRVLIYNGQNDVLVNTPGVLQYLNGLSWEGIAQWKKTQKTMWTIYGKTKGWVKNSGNLWFILVNNAGHLVPSDESESAFNMFGHFIRNDNDWKQ